VPAGRLSAPQRRLLDWGARVRRDLPWRRSRDPWLVLVSEVMLGQTQVGRVEPRWSAFAERWPTPASLAADPLSGLLVFWQGLGYPRRAVNLHHSAGVIVAEHGGAVPSSLDELLSLRGVGPYTARAVLAFALEADVGVVDTNIARVLARVAGERLTPRRAQELADGWVPAGQGWAWNQSMMDLGALRCRPVAPSCVGCPLARECRWRLGGFASPDPAIGSAGVSGRQARYQGSDRQLRGRVLDRLVEGPLPAEEVGEVVGAAGRAGSIIDGLVADGLVSRVGGTLVLGGG